MDTKTVNGIDGSHLKSYIEKVERLEEDKKAIADDIREVYAEAKAYGFDVKIMREVIKLRKFDSAELFEQESMLEIYKTALGMDVEEENESSEAAA